MFYKEFNKMVLERIKYCNSSFLDEKDLCICVSGRGVTAYFAFNLLFPKNHYESRISAFSGATSYYPLFNSVVSSSI